MFFNAFIKDLGAGINCTLSIFSNETKLGEAVDSFVGREALQRSLDRLERWAITNNVKFNKSKCKILCLGWCGPGYTYKLGHGRLESSPMKRHLKVWVDGKLNMSQQCVLAAKRDNCVLGWIKCSIASQLREDIVPRYTALAWPHLKYCMQFWLWLPQYKKDIKLLECIWRRATEMVKGLEGKTYKEWLRSCVCSGGKRRLRDDLITAYSFLRGATEGCLLMSLC